MKKLLLLIFTFSLSIGFAQITINGTITDQNGNPLPSVNVVLSQKTQGTTTNFEGKYEITTNLKGNQEIKVMYLGYKTVTKKIDLSKNITIDFTLVESVESLDGIVITATSTRRSQKETPLSITSFGAKKLSSVNTSSQADILASVPGITTEGGGGEVASNVFVRGLPSGGQFQFNPLQIDGMPVLSTFGLNSSAHDVYFRNDIGMKSMEFVRGGSSILYGVGSVAGIINYTSYTGTDTPKNIIRLETATKSRYKADFLTAGKLGSEDSNLYYALSGFYRYDEGPLKTGLPTEGYQLRGNLKKLTEKGSLVISGQYIDDQVQFFLPYPLEGGTRNRPKGNDGRTIMTLQTADAADISYPTPNGIYHSPIRDGVSTIGGYLMVNFKHNFSDDLKLNVKLRYSKYKHMFNLFLDGSGVSGAKVVETQQEYMTARGITSGTFSYLNGQPIDSNALLFENRILDRNRPLRELVGDFKLTKIAGPHTITGGAFISRSEAGDFNVITNYLSEYNDRPKLVELSGYSVNGVTNRGTAYTNRNISSNKIAFFLTDEIKLDNWNFDMGIRVENASGDIRNEGKQSYTVDNTGINNLDNVVWGNGNYTRGHVSATDFAVALAALRKINDNLSAYVNFSRGYFFPELRGTKFDSNGDPSSYKTEKIIQGELGLKYGSSNFSGTFATYYTTLKDRRSISFINASGGGFDEAVDKQNTRTYGIEGTWNYKFAQNFSFNGSLTYQDHQLTKSEKDPSLEGNKLRRQPNFLTTLGVLFDNEKFDGNFTFNYNGDKYANDANSIKLDGFGVANLNLGYTFPMSENNETLRLGMQVYNLFNSEGITEGSPRLGNNQTEEEYFVGRPILPQRLFMNITFNF